MSQNTISFFKMSNLAPSAPLSRECFFTIYKLSQSVQQFPCLLLIKPPDVLSENGSKTGLLQSIDDIFSGCSHKHYLKKNKIYHFTFRNTFTFSKSLLSLNTFSDKWVYRTSRGFQLF